ncbi:hypothetical protein KIW84_033937 [Lathyrus oleraceus]|uniref:RNA helicase n=1 Tax=Pisum sativum TaxID=3888 RepID=A0A9D4XXZ9_PEA|nr:hypothetical protein KIW84_033937 [Pisum sativum]KAI5429134.1 hypothetical protein KIW84_033937 [Pisum sativum]
MRNSVAPCHFFNLVVKNLLIVSFILLFDYHSLPCIVSLGCFQLALGREGVALAAMMPNASNIFCRFGNEGDKQRSDCLKVQFCHSDGDLFTLLSVYKEWEALPQERRNKWCWENSINAKSMRRCQDTVFELESFLEREHGFVVPSYWRWDPHTPSVHDKNMKKVILASLSENVAMFSGRNQLGYEVAQTGQHVQLHPSSSLLVFAQKPSWVVFGDLLSVSNVWSVLVLLSFNHYTTFNPLPRLMYPRWKNGSCKLRH